LHFAHWSTIRGLDQSEAVCGLVFAADCLQRNRERPCAGVLCARMGCEMETVATCGSDESERPTAIDLD
jgi:hypothetical protein